MLTRIILVGVQLKADEERFHREQEEFKVAHSKSWEVDIEEKRRFMKTLPDKEAFQSTIKARRTSEFAQLQARPCSFILPEPVPAVLCVIRGQLYLRCSLQRQRAAIPVQWLASTYFLTPPWASVVY